MRDKPQVGSFSMKSMVLESLPPPRLFKIPNLVDGASESKAKKHNDDNE